MPAWLSKARLGRAWLAGVLGGGWSQAHAGAAPQKPFTEEAPARGLSYGFGGAVLPYWPFGYGVAFADLDDDGDPDVVLVGAPDGRVGVFENDGGGHFIDRSAGSGIPSVDRASGVTAGDFDADGDLDLYITLWFGPNMLLRNEGAFHFVDVAASAGVADDGAGAGCAWGDFDHDGWLDLYVANRTFSQGPGGESLNPNLLYRNLGDGTFQEASAAAGVYDENYTFQGVFFDQDNDGDADLYLSTDKGYAGIGLNRLFENVGGVFSDITATSGTGVRINSMGVAVGDFDRDGLQDLYCTNTNEGNPLFINQGGGSFVESAAAAGVSSNATGWGAVLFDFDNDAHTDLYVCNSDAPNRLYRYAGAWPCENIAAAMAVADAGFSFGVAAADVDLDGDLDLLVQNDYGPPALYINHEGQTRSWARFDVLGADQNTRAIGAQVRVRTAGVWQVREALAGGNGYKGQNELTLHFGLDAALLVDEIEARWPRGATRTLTGYGADRRWTLFPAQRLGDVDGDGALSAADFYAFLACYGAPFEPGCEVMDFDGDANVDLDDFEAFETRYYASFGGVRDCDGDGDSDLYDILTGASLDANANAVPDECELAGDLDGDGDVDLADLALLLADYGCAAAPCPADLDGDGDTDLADLSVLLSQFGATGP